ncbi:hypothetical protein [Pseudoxanthomonas daejeonensis]|nr:hypothetical protein [Pseudoxanthomonas daejeonensis]
MSRMAAWACAGVWLALVAAGPARALTIMEMDYQCPVGGERFRQETAGSGTAFGHYLDGQAYGPIMSPWPLAKCPGNGFVMYRDDFSPAELEVLTAFVQGQAYQQLRQTETTYWLAASLQEALGVSLVDRAGTLMRATWQASPAQYPHYVEAAAAAFAAACPDDAAHTQRDEQWLYCQLIRGEWERRTSRFDAARARFEHLQPLPPQLVGDADARAQYASEVAQQLALVEQGDARRTMASMAGKDAGVAGDVEAAADAAADPGR